MSTENKICQNCKQSYTVELDDVSFYQRMQVPVPKLCPDCRFQRRALFRNEMALYNRKCDLCKASIISMYHPSAAYKVYCTACYESDAWDAYDYAMEYNSSKPFFDQLGALMRAVPKKALYTTSVAGPNINSPYINAAGGCKDSYMIFNGGNTEDSMYCRGVRFSNNTLDAYFGMKLENCYEAINCQQSSGIMYGQNITGSVDCYFGLNLSGCTNCFGCVNLRGASYCFFNEQVSKEEYDRRVRDVLGSYRKMENMQRRFDEHSLKYPRRETTNLKTVNSTGNFLSGCKNVRDSFEVMDSENCSYCFWSKGTKDSIGTMGYGWSSELLCECIAVGFSSRVIGSYGVDNAQDVSYSFCITGCHDCFGCDGIKKAEFCILNKRYSPEEYARLKENIISELRQDEVYGLSFPPSLAPFAYNETVGQDNMPLTEEQAKSYGYRWQSDAQRTTGKETLQPERIPDNINDVTDASLKDIYRCIGCSRNYLVTPAELLFYRKMMLPLPRKCFFCRHADRLVRRGPMKIFDRTCAKCNKDIQTTYAPERPEIVYCESCYQNEVA